ncbi:MAG TPA: hypothetical protein DCL21_02765 [Alphaproteobacteria bacterium]|mgnify:CR=1 FL=1|nr:hypothetical protein [Alphaproteobacteria bacterium]
MGFKTVIAGTIIGALVGGSIASLRDMALEDHLISNITAESSISDMDIPNYVLIKALKKANYHIDGEKRYLEKTRTSHCSLKDLEVTCDVSLYSEQGNGSSATIAIEDEKSIAIIVNTFIEGELVKI